MAGTGKAHLRPADETLVRIEDLVVEFPAPGGRSVKAVSGISLDIKEGETLGLVGESGCGKTTTGRAVIQLPPPTSGSVVFDGTELTALSELQMRRQRTDMQMIFQDPISSLNPRRRVKDIVSEGLEIWSDGDIGTEGRERVKEVLHAVGIDPASAASHRPHQFSGGQCQRISIARALTVNPEILICDEPVSALDVSVQAKILNLLEDMKARYDLSLVFISHDLSVVRNVSDRVVVMYLGKLCEVGDADRLYEAPAHPYTRALLASAPEPAQSVGVADAVLGDEIPSPTDPPSGCRFRTRCPLAFDRCAVEEPQMRQLGEDHFVACHLPST